MKRMIGYAAGVAAAALMAVSASAQDVTMTLHHFIGPKAPAHSKMLVPWAKSVEEASGGRIKIEIFPAMAMGGKPPELYRQLRDGAADIVWTVLGYTPGVFPRSEVFELPGVHQGSARDTTMAIIDSFDMVAEDFKDIKPILIHTHAGQAIHTVEKPVRSPDDMAGMKLRTPSRTGGWTIEAYGAEPVGMPIPALPQALSKGVVAGTLVPFEVMPPLKLQELTKYSTVGPNDSRFGTSTFMIGMNKDTYEGLPDDLKKVIDDHSMGAIAETYGQVWDDVEAFGQKLRRENGEIITLTADEMKAFDAKADAVVNKWIAEADAAGRDGKAMVEAARAAVAKQSGN